jgi:PAS domain S-box-containing protein
LRAEKERDRAKNELRASETRYRNLAELSPVGIFECDPGGGYRYVNESWCSMAGLPADEALDEGWLRAIHEADRARVLTSWKGAVSGGSQLSIEHRFRRPDGSVRVVLTQALPNQDSEGNIAGHIGTVTDLTDVRAAQDQLRIRERQLAAVTAHLPVLMFSVDANLRYRFAAGETEGLFGIPAEEVTGRRSRGRRAPCSNESLLEPGSISKSQLREPADGGCESLSFPTWSPPERSLDIFRSRWT